MGFTSPRIRKAKDSGWGNACLFKQKSQSFKLSIPVTAKVKHLNSSVLCPNPYLNPNLQFNCVKNLLNKIREKPSTPERSFFFFAVLGFELRAYLHLQPLYHSFFMLGIFEIGSR
jgi:hypothetical protein